MGCQTVQPFYMERQICDIGPEPEATQFFRPVWDT